MPDVHYKVVNGERIQFTAEEETELAERRAAADLDFTHIRMTRNGLLKGTDWTQIGDAVLGDHTAEEWATYRQALRDYPSQSDKVSTLPEWPEDPPTAKINRKVAAGQAAYSLSIEDGDTEEEAQTAYDTAYAATD